MKNYESKLKPAIVDGDASDIRVVSIVTIKQKRYGIGSTYIVSKDIGPDDTPYFMVWLHLGRTALPFSTPCWRHPFLRHRRRAPAPQPEEAWITRDCENFYWVDSTSVGDGHESDEDCFCLEVDEIDEYSNWFRMRICRERRFIDFDTTLAIKSALEGLKIEDILGKG